MAGYWIKWVKGLARRPEVVDMAKSLGKSRHEIAGLCMEVWEWADDNVDPGDASENCPGFVHIVSAECSTIDGLIGAQGFAEAMKNAGWIDFEKGQIIFPRFGRHNGKHAKHRALDAERKRNSRQENVRKTSASKADKKRTRGEERRVEYISNERANDRSSETTNLDEAKRVSAEIWKHVPTVKGDVRIVLKASLAVASGIISEAAVLSAASTTGAEPRQKPMAYFTKALQKQCEHAQPPIDFTRILAIQIPGNQK